MTTPPSDDARPREALGQRSAAADPDFATFFAVSLDLLVIRDADFRIVKANPAWETVLGWTTEELEGQPMLAFIHPDDVPSSHGEMRRMKRDEEVRGFVNRYRCKNGGYRHLEWRARRQGDLVYGVARDVTERLAFEAEMAAAREEAEAANRSKSVFLANMSHEIRTPLNGVIGVAAALAKTGLSSEQTEMVELIQTSGAILERVVSDVLDVSKIEAGKLEIEVGPFDLRSELDALLELYRLQAQEKGLAFRVAYGEGAHGTFLGDVTRIKQVLGNLLSNAVKFTAQGEIRTRVEVREAAGTAELALSVEDTGVGFDAAAAGHLFQRFSQADGSVTRRFGGTGLGLSISRALVEMMGGQISATASPDRGSCFQVSLPLPRARIPGPPSGDGTAPDLEAAAPPRLDGLKVLLAEDHPINQRVVQLILGPLGVDLVTVADGAEAVRAFAAGRFDLVLMDMQMPVMDGLAATLQIRAIEAAAPDRPRTPVIMLSANAMREHGEEAMAAGADLHLAKPVTAASLLHGLARALG
jgi:PAS domain S-box-containing protein